MYETFEHTADLGIRVRAASFEELCQEAGRAVQDLLSGDADAIASRRRQVFMVEGQEKDDLLLDFLSELLYRFESENMLYSQLAVRQTNAGLTIRAAGEPFHRERHGGGREVKAVTYHGLLVQHDDEGWLAELIVDI